MTIKKPDIIVGDQSLRYRWAMTISLYLLLLLLFEPLLDHFLKALLFEPTPEGIATLNEKKQLFASWGFMLLRSIPLLLFLWLGWQVARSRRLPSPGLRLPFTVCLIQGPKAQLIGMGMIAVALLSLLREVSHLVSVLAVSG